MFSSALNCGRPLSQDIAANCTVCEVDVTYQLYVEQLGKSVSVPNLHLSSDSLCVTSENLRHGKVLPRRFV